ncbi:hypothetical protein DID88_006392 [Monilinia fructigena]|uniref:Peroxin/Ferlin domain-containing protein n=1 Tax=Monilinia fructigena TaxID=38457 RepID=A0A395IE09_9HELO|nr:hypothetical protein DID88_006392 [Monilinia fructigena]
MAAFDTPWLDQMSGTPSSRKDDHGASLTPTDPNPPTIAAFSPVTLSHASSANKQRSTILVHQKSPLLLATPPQITRALAYSHPFLLPLNKLAEKESQKSRFRDYKYQTSKDFGRDCRDVEDIYIEVQCTFGSSITIDGFSVNSTNGYICHNSSSTYNTFITNSSRHTHLDHFDTPPLQVITTKRIALVTGTIFLTWHSRPNRIARTILWRSSLVRRICTAMTGLYLTDELSPTANGVDDKPPLPPRTASSYADATLAANAAMKRRPEAPGVKFTFILYENQRRWVGLGWTTSLFAYERSAWTDEHLNAVPPKEDFELPDWQNGRRGQDGWEEYTRRRKWYRDAELVEITSSTEITPSPTPTHISQSLDSTSARARLSSFSDSRSSSPPPDYSDREDASLKSNRSSRFGSKKSSLKKERLEGEVGRVA